MVPNHRKGIVHLRVIEEVVAQSTVVGSFCGWNPVNGKAGVIFTGYIGIQTPVELLVVRIGWVAGAVFGNVGDV